MFFRSTWMLIAVAVAAAFALAWPYRDIPASRMAAWKTVGPLAAAKTWHYQLDNIDVDKLARTPADVMVIDFAKKDGKVPLSAAEVARIKSGPDGKGRYVLAYLSVGEAEEFRSYWRPEWKEDPPDWLGEENCAWPQAHRVRYWLPGWKDINFRGPESYLRRIIEAGFDGVYLDRVDIFETYEAARPAAREEMIAYVGELARTAWHLRPGFFIVPQNAESLLDSADYRSFIDGLGKESLYFGLHATAARNAPGEIESSAQFLRRLQHDDKPVFVVEYLIDAAHIAASGAELRAGRFVPTFQTRALDGNDPTAPVVLSQEVGTPERTTKECAPGTSW